MGVYELNDVSTPLYEAYVAALKRNAENVTRIDKVGTTMNLGLRLDVAETLAEINRLSAELEPYLLTR